MDWQCSQDVLNDIHNAKLESNDPLLYELSEKGVEAFPDSAELWAFRARYLWILRREDESDEALEKAFKLNPDCALAWAVRSTIAAASGMTDESIESAKKALKLNNNHDPSVIEYCQDAFYVSGDTATTLSLTKLLCEQNPNDPMGFAHHVTSLIGSGRKQEALQFLEEAERRFPDCVHLMRRRALLIMGSELAESIRLFRFCTEKSPGCSTSWAQLSMPLVAAQLYVEAEYAAKRALEINPRAITAMKSMARICMRRGQAQEAKEWQQKAADAIPGIAYSTALTSAGNAMRLGQWKKVLKLIEPAISAPTLHIKQVALSFKARALVELGQFKKAEYVLDQLEETGWDDPGKYEMRGRIALAHWNRDDALAHFREGLQKYPTNGLLRAQLVKLLQGDAFKSERENLISDILDNPPDTPWGLASVARALLNAGYKQEAYKLRWICQQRFPQARQFHMLSLGDWLRFVWALFKLMIRVKLLKYKMRGSKKK